ncbi:hypothetical protein EW146_g10288 [Bondarzewia mesenterica]|uniref:Uncharacterized protein n=1 Tax=Bondarzewia mesenterica TaxID=1095465 RepID=A0A4S4L0I2_9AGAM|nr:hypothetical protein EW146_g10288 [Bondarzewia mesenterica]
MPLRSKTRNYGIINSEDVEKWNPTNWKSVEGALTIDVRVKFGYAEAGRAFEPSDGPSGLVLTGRSGGIATKVTANIGGDAGQSPAASDEASLLKVSAH